ncbi:A/G-specific adenine glycosylase [Oxalobacteraceae bacterium R-40]|uniref:Adenine DNA glycosylase n=1 Tax=Keguizhuia sedimenti TaxID=3064264 RepID=A0ABU1BLE7_9BURK|nr:A/G-specific adenine glycosylase [Oxalobacteraceae bacterium R-40]
MKRVLAVNFPEVSVSSSRENDGILRNETVNSGLANEVIAWQRQHGRHALPWQNTRDAYRIWISEIMLQQTQVAAVIPYYERFMRRFPTVQSLAEASSEEVMSHWSGLGYYSRARNLHRCAQIVTAEYGGVFPREPEVLGELPGIGRSTAAAISAFAYGTRAAILDGNVKRVFCRVFGVDGYPGERKIEQALWELAVSLLPQENMTAYTQGLMDLGATICTRNKPACTSCPLNERCIALQSGRINELPVRKPKKAIPEKHAVMLIITHGDQVLLEQRPNAGIWGGLLSLPQFDDTRIAMSGGKTESASLDTAISQAIMPFGTMASCESLPRFSHTFTHFKLHISPVRIGLARRLEMAGQSSHIWYGFEQLAQAPLPAPVKKLLTGLFNSQDLLIGLN